MHNNLLGTMDSGPAENRFPVVHRTALLCLVLISMSVNAWHVSWYFHHNPLTSDLRIFMTGVEMVRTGEGHNLYRFHDQEAVQNRLYPQTRNGGLLPFNHLAYELLLYWPLSWLPYQSALIAWALFNLGIVFLIGYLLRPYAGSLHRRTGIPLAMWLLAFYPLAYVFGQGQDSLLFLLLLVLSLRAACATRFFAAGLLLSLALFKFHLVLLIAFFLFVLPRNWRALAGLAAGSASVVLISMAMVGPSFSRDYLSMLRQQEVMTPWGFIPWFMPNLRGLLQWSLSHWMDIGSILPVIFVASAAVFVVASWIVARRSTLDVPLLYAFAIPTALLVSYHLHMQDLSLAILPLLILVERALGGGLDRIWIAVLLVAICGFFGFRLAAEPFQILLVRGCLLSLPLLLLWIVAGRVFLQATSYPSTREI